MRNLIYCSPTRCKNHLLIDSFCKTQAYGVSNKRHRGIKVGRFTAFLLASAGILMASGVASQEAATTTEGVQATQAVVLKTSSESVLRAGTPVALRMMESLTTKEKKLRVGQRFNMEVADAVYLGDQIVIPAGSPAVGELTDVRNKGMWGKSGRIGARVLHVRVQGRQIRLTGQFDDKGVTGTAGVVAAIALVPIAGFFTTGTSAKIDSGAGIPAFLDEDITIAMAPVAPAPLQPTAPQSIQPTPATAIMAQ